MNRQAIPKEIETLVITNSKRRCALCVGLNANWEEKKGQIAHLNGNKNDNRYKNLVWLCFEHHDEFDSQTSQSKNYTRNEVEIYRDQIYAKYLSADFDCNEIERLRHLLTTYAPLFNYI